MVRSSAPEAHRLGYGGEQLMGFILGEDGYFLVDGPSGGSGHGGTESGFDGVAFHPQKKELIIYDNKASRNAVNVTKATAIHPEVNLRKNIGKMLDLLEGRDPKKKLASENLKHMPCRNEIVKRLKECRAAVDK